MESTSPAFFCTTRKESRTANPKVTTVVNVDTSVVETWNLGWLKNSEMKE
jgi:hypothetical protein